jgi:hypothetical protein
VCHNRIAITISLHGEKYQRMDTYGIKREDGTTSGQEDFERSPTESGYLEIPEQD